MIGRRGGPPSDRDSTETIEWFNIIATSLAVGAAAGAAIGFMAFRWEPMKGALILGLPCAGVAFAVLYVVVEGSGAFVAGLHTPAATPRRYQLSREQALIVAGRLDEAAAALAEVHEREPDDPRAAQILAELYRDQIGDLDEAAAWYRRAASVPGIDVDTERMLLRELVELCRDRMGRPELATPALARAAQLHEHDRLGNWARTQIREIKSGPAPASVDEPHTASDGGPGGHETSD